MRINLFLEFCYLRKNAFEFSNYRKNHLLQVANAKDDSAVSQPTIWDHYSQLLDNKPPRISVHKGTRCRARRPINKIIRCVWNNLHVY